MNLIKKIKNKKVLIRTFILLFCFLLLPLQTFATAYSVSGTLSPDATTANTGEPAGTYNEGQDYWTWTNSAGTWYLFAWKFNRSNVPLYVISSSLTLFIGEYWEHIYDVDPAGSYEPVGYTGIATVTEVANTAPNAPTLVSPLSNNYVSDTTPTLSANYSDPDTADTGTTNYRIATSVANCTSGTTVASGTSSATSDENENTIWTPNSSIGSDATYYWCAQNDDGTAQSAWTSMGSFILDTVVPTITNTANSLGTLTNTQTATITWTTDEASSTQLEYGLNTSYGNTTTETDTTTRVLSHTDSVPLDPCKTYHARVISKDPATNQATGDDFTIQTACGGGGGGGGGGSGSGGSGDGSGEGNGSSSGDGVWPMPIPLPPVPAVVHNICNDQKCASVDGEGANECQTDNDCIICNEYGDINKDGKTNLADFSIIMHYWKQANPVNTCADTNKDGAVNLKDLSIVFYWWMR